MNGKQSIIRVLSGDSVWPPPVMPIVHTALARYAGVPLGRYFTDPRTMSDVVVSGCRRLGLDGVQLTLGVTGEAEALGAHVEQPADGSPLLKGHVLEDYSQLPDLRSRDPSGGRLPMYQEAVRMVADQIGQDAFVLSTLRGPLNIASQLRGVERVLVDMLRRPDSAAELLDFTADVAIAVSRASLQSGADALVFGEATCSPNFISPKMYRSLVHPRHVRLVAALREMGWQFVGLHICGNILPILEDLIATGVDFVDVDYQVDASEAITLTRNRIALRGNINPTDLFLSRDPAEIRRRTAALVDAVRGSRWIVSTGCDTPPGTPADNVAALVQACRSEPRP